MQIHYFQKHLTKPFLHHKFQMQTLNLTEANLNIIIYLNNFKIDL